LLVTEILKINRPIRRIQRGHFFADIVISRSGRGQIFHYVIQPEESQAVLSWGQERSLEAAEQAAQYYLDLLTRQPRNA